MDPIIQLPTFNSPEVDTQAESCARVIGAGFADYNRRFSIITGRARQHFESRDWPAARIDAVARIELYDQCIGETTLALQGQLLDRPQDRQLWSTVRDHYSRLIAPLLDQELYKTFFNTLTRRFFRTRRALASRVSNAFFNLTARFADRRICQINRNGRHIVEQIQI